MRVRYNSGKIFPYPTKNGYLQKNSGKHFRYHPSILRIILNPVNYRKTFPLFFKIEANPKNSGKHFRYIFQWTTPGDGTLLKSTPAAPISQTHQLSTIKVTGPSFTSDTCIIAPKTPVCTSIPFSRSFSLNASYSGSACSGLAAFIKLGRLPFRQSP